MVAPEQAGVAALTLAPAGVGGSGGSPLQASRIVSPSGRVLSPLGGGKVAAADAQRRRNQRSASRAKLLKAQNWAAEVPDETGYLAPLRGAEPPGHWMTRNIDALKLKSSQDARRLRDREAQTLLGCRDEVCEVLDRAVEAAKGLNMETTILGTAMCDVNEVFQRYEVQLDENPPWLTEEIEILECMRTDVTHLSQDHREDIIAHLRSIIRGLFKDKEVAEERFAKAEQDVSRKDAVIKYIKRTLWHEVVLLREQLHKKDDTGYFDRNVFSIFDVMEMVERMQGGSEAAAAVEQHVMGGDALRQQLDDQLERNRLTWEARCREMSNAYEREIKTLKDQVAGLRDAVHAAEEAARDVHLDVPTPKSIRATEEEMTALREEIQQLQCDARELRTRNASLESIVAHHDAAFEASLSESAKEVSDLKAQLRRREAEGARASNLLAAAQKNVENLETNLSFRTDEVADLAKKNATLERENVNMAATIKGFEPELNVMTLKCEAAEAAATELRERAEKEQAAAKASHEQNEEMLVLLKKERQRMDDLQADVARLEGQVNRAHEARDKALAEVAQMDAMAAQIDTLQAGVAERDEQIAALRKELSKSHFADAASSASLKKECVALTMEVKELKALRTKLTSELTVKTEALEAATDELQTLRREHNALLDTEVDLREALEGEATQHQDLLEGLQGVVEGFRDVLVVLMDIQPAEECRSDFRTHLATLEELAGFDIFTPPTPEAQPHRRASLFSIASTSSPARGGRRGSRMVSVVSRASTQARGNMFTARKEALEAVVALLTHHAGQQSADYRTRVRHRKPAKEALLRAESGFAVNADATLRQLNTAITRASGLVVLQTDASLSAVFNSQLAAVQCAADLMDAFPGMKFAVADGDIDDRGHGSAESNAQALLALAPAGTLVFSNALGERIRARDVGNMPAYAVTANDVEVVMLKGPAETGPRESDPAAVITRTANRLRNSISWPATSGEGDEGGDDATAPPTVTAFDGFIPDDEAAGADAGSTLAGLPQTMVARRAQQRRSRTSLSGGGGGQDDAARRASVVSLMSPASEAPSPTAGSPAVLPQREALLLDGLQEAVEACLLDKDRLLAERNADRMALRWARKELARLRRALTASADAAHDDAMARFRRMEDAADQQAAEIARLTAALTAAAEEAEKLTTELGFAEGRIARAEESAGLAQETATRLSRRYSRQSPLSQPSMGTPGMHVASTQTLATLVADEKGESPLTSRAPSVVTAVVIDDYPPPVPTPTPAPPEPEPEPELPVASRKPSSVQEVPTPSPAPIVDDVPDPPIALSSGPIVVPTATLTPRREVRDAACTAGVDVDDHSTQTEEAPPPPPPYTPGMESASQQSGVGPWNAPTPTLMSSARGTSTPKLVALQRGADGWRKSMDKAERRRSTVQHQPPGSHKHWQRVKKDVLVDGKRRSRVEAGPEDAGRARDRSGSAQSMRSVASSPRKAARHGPQARPTSAGEGSVCAPVLGASPRARLDNRGGGSGSARKATVRVVQDVDSRPGSAASGRPMSVPSTPAEGGAPCSPPDDSIFAAAIGVLAQRPVVSLAELPRATSMNMSGETVGSVVSGRDVMAESLAQISPPSMKKKRMSSLAPVLPEWAPDEDDDDDAGSGGGGGTSPTAPATMLLRDAGGSGRAAGGPTHANNPFDSPHMERPRTRCAVVRQRGVRTGSPPRTLASGVSIPVGRVPPPEMVGATLAGVPQGEYAATAPAGAVMEVLPDDLPNPDVDVDDLAAPVDGGDLGILTAVRHVVVPAHGRPTLTAKYVPTSLAVSGRAVPGPNPTQQALDVTRTVREVRRVVDASKAQRAASTALALPKDAACPLMRATGTPGLLGTPTPPPLEDTGCRDIVPYQPPQSTVHDPFLDYMRFVPEDPVDVLAVAVRPGGGGKRAGSARSGRPRAQLKDIHPTIASIMGFPKRGGPLVGEDFSAAQRGRPPSGARASLVDRALARGGKEFARPATGNPVRRGTTRLPPAR